MKGECDVTKCEEFKGVFWSAVVASRRQVTDLGADLVPKRSDRSVACGLPYQPAGAAFEASIDFRLDQEFGGLVA